MEIGDIVMVPCQVVGKHSLAYVDNIALDLLPVEYSSGEPYSKDVVNMFSVLKQDVIELGKGEGEDAKD